MLADSGWPAWSIETNPGGLAAYVRPEIVAPLLPQVPAATTESILTRARHTYELIAERQVGYAFEPALTATGAQLIRTPQEVLWAPRHGTCLDLALIYSGALLTAGLISAVIILEPDSPELPRHALVAIPVIEAVGKLWAAPTTTDEPPVWSTVPGWLEDAVEPGLDGDVLLVDPSGLGHDLGTSRAVGLTASFEAAVAGGAAYLRSARWSWRLGVPVLADGRARHQPPEAPPQMPLRDPYLPPDQAPTSLQVLRPEYELVPFQSRHELTVLRDWCEQVRAGDRTGLAVITAIGGAGKTRLALELADQLRLRGWYAGTLPRGGSVDWLAKVVSPLLVVVDYADARVGTSRDPGDARRLLAALRERPGPPAVVILTARPGRGQWWEDLQGALADDRHPHRYENFRLTDQHPRPRDVYAQTVRRLIPGRIDVPAPPDPGPERWTTLDLVLLGWLAAQEPDATVPASRSDLYEKALVHELAYWATRYEDLRRDVSPDRSLLRTAGAYVSLLQPVADDLDGVLRTIEGLADDPTERSVVRRLLLGCLDAEDEQGIAVRPDPVGDHLVLTELRLRPGLLHDLTEDASPAVVRQILTTLNRAGQRDPDFIASTIAGFLARRPVLWLEVLLVAASQGGSALEAFEERIESADNEIPLDEVSDLLPFSALALYDLGETVDRLRVAEARAADSPPLDIADLLMRHSRRAITAGNSSVARTSATEALDLLRTTRAKDSAARSNLMMLALRQLAIISESDGEPSQATKFTREAVALCRERCRTDPGSNRLLGILLSQLAHCQAQTGDRAGAVASATESVDVLRRVPHPGSTESRAELAEAISTLSTHVVGFGDTEQAIALAQEAVDMLSALEADHPSVQSELAAALERLGKCQTRSGDVEGALVSISAGADIRERLSQIAPARYLPALAGNLNNLFVALRSVGEDDAALSTIERSVDIYARLGVMNPAVYLGPLAQALTNLSNVRSDRGDLGEAFDTAGRAVDIRRRLVEINPVGGLSGLALALDAITGIQAARGDLDGALASMQESVTLLKRCGKVNPEQDLPHLARALSNLAARLGAVGRHAEALTTVEESVTAYRLLVRTDPVENLPGLANALNNLVGCYITSGDLQSALAVMHETVGLYRQLVGVNAAAYMSEYARALSNLSNRQAAVGQVRAALESIEKAVEMRRELARQNPGTELGRLANSLQNLSLHQAAIGRYNAAITAIGEACQIMEVVAAANPAHLPQLASALNNRAKIHTEISDVQRAQSYAERSLAIYRYLAEANPSAFLENLPTALYNAAAHRARNNDDAGALAASRESLDVRRQLMQENEAYRPLLASGLTSLANQLIDDEHIAEATSLAEEAIVINAGLAKRNPSTHLPDLASNLTLLAACYGKGGDRKRALTVMREAVEIRDQLAKEIPEKHLSWLAHDLSILGRHQAHDEDFAGALATYRRSLPMHQQLAVADPAAYLPGVVSALQAMSELLSETDALDQIPAIWAETLAALTVPLTRAEVRGYWAWQLRQTGSQADGLIQLRLAVAEVDGADEDGDTPAVILTVTRSRARDAIRQVALGYGLQDDTSWPTWVSATITEDVLTLANAVQQAEGWPQMREALETHRHVLEHEGVRNAFLALSDLRPDLGTGPWVVDLLDEIAATDFASVLTEHERVHGCRVLIAGWLSTETWGQSKLFHEEHLDELKDPAIGELLMADDSEASRQHAAIWVLVGAWGLDRTYLTVTEPNVAEIAVLEAIEAGELELLTFLFMASDALRTRGLTYALTSMVLSLEGDTTDRAEQIATMIAGDANDTERRAFCVHLRGLRSRRPELAGLDRVIGILSGSDAR